MTPLELFLAAGRDAGCPREQMEKFARAGVVLQPRQLAASAAARLCDLADGPTAVGYGGARGGASGENVSDDVVEVGDMPTYSKCVGFHGCCLPRNWWRCISPP